MCVKCVGAMNKLVKIKDIKNTGNETKSNVSITPHLSQNC